MPRLRRLNVDDPTDPRLADYVALRDAHLRATVEGETGTFIAEGALVVRQLLTSAYRVKSVLVTPRKLAALEEDLERHLDPATPVYVAPRDLLRIERAQ